MHHCRIAERAGTRWRWSDLAPEACALGLPCLRNARTVWTARHPARPALHAGSADAGAHPPYRLGKDASGMARTGLSAVGRGIFNDRSDAARVDARTRQPARDALAGARHPGVSPTPVCRHSRPSADTPCTSTVSPGVFALSIGTELAGITTLPAPLGRAYAYLGGFDPQFAYYSPARS